MKAISYQPKYPEALSNLGNIYYEKGDIKKSLECFKKALKIIPNSPEALVNLGRSQRILGDFEKAILSFKKAIQCQPDCSDAFLNLGNLEKDKGDLKSALKLYKRAIELNPNNVDAYTNLGGLFHSRGDLGSSILSYQSALSINEKSLEANLNLSISLLLSGNYKLGWEKYEWRLRTKKARNLFKRFYRLEEWKPDFSMSNQQMEVLVVCEQGLGDTFQFMRYVSCLKEKGLNVSMSAPKVLHELIRTSNICNDLYSTDQTSSIYGRKWIPLLSLPKYLCVTPENPLITDPYIFIPNEIKDYWRKVFAEEEGLKIGINWQGNPLAEKGSLKGRSFALDEFQLIAKNISGKFVSLQKGYGADQLEECSFRNNFVSFQDKINTRKDFLTTAAIIANCDLVITSDTSIAHLSGGLGVQTWLLLHKTPDWRWGLSVDKTFWYPSIRIFRQKSNGNWKDVMNHILNELKVWRR